MAGASGSELDRKIGQRVRARRMEIGVAQMDLAERIGVTFQQLQKYEKGVNRIAACRLFSIAEELRVPPAYFFVALPQSSGAEHPRLAEGATDRLSLELLLLYSRMRSPDLRRRVTELVEALADIGNDDAPPTLTPTTMPAPAKALPQGK